MAKQWKQSLEQSDILSDGQPFDGANIDAPISEAGQGVDWSSMTPFGASKWESDGEPSVSVSGSGYITHAEFTATEANNQGAVNLTVDGSSKNQSGIIRETTDYITLTVVSGPIRFNSSFSVSVSDFNFNGGANAGLWVFGVFD